MALNELQISLLDDQQRERYNALEKLFESPGWKIIQEFAETSAQAQADRALAATDWPTNRTAIGARAAFIQVANLQQITEIEFSNLAAQAAAAQEDEDEIDYE